MGKAYLGWQIFFHGMLKNIEAHVTLKYIGGNPYTIENLRQRLSNLDTVFYQADLSWVHEIFGPPEAPVDVMVLGGFNPALLQARAAVEDLRQDDFPEWRPHITLAKPVCEFLVYSRATPQSVILGASELALFVDKKPLCYFPSQSGKIKAACGVEL